LRRDASPPSDAAFENWKCRETFFCSASVEEMEDRLEGVVAKAFGKRPRRKTVESRGQVLLVEKNRYARLGPYVAHVSLLAILLGTLWGAVQGFKGGLQLAEGEASSEAWLRTGAQRVPLGFQIRCDRFVFEQYPNGTPKEYRSEVTLSEVGGEKIKSGTIRVNHPLTYRGITFYQSTYGSLPELNLRVRDREGGSESMVTTRLNAPFLLPGSQGERAMVVSFQENLRIPEEMARITSFSKRSLGPAAQIVVFDDKGFGEPFWVFRDHPDMGKKAERPHKFVMEDVRLMSYTGLQVVKDPGAPLVWIGCTFLVIGFLMALLMDHEIVWVAGEVAAENEYRVRVVGRAVRHPGIYAARFDRQKFRLRRGLSPWLKKPLGDL
jgi:cytochrome c biogenesis protein